MLFGGLLCLVCWELLRKRFFLLGSFFVIGLLFLGTYGIFVGRTGGLIWHPLWPPHELLRTFSWYGYDEKIYTFSHQHVIRGLIETEFYGFFLFLIGNLGTRIIGLLGLVLLIWKKRKFPSLFAFSLLVMLIISILIPLFFIQTGKVFEIIQMANYYLFFVSLFACFGLAKFSSLQFRFSKVIKVLCLVVFVSFTLPSAFVVYKNKVVDAAVRTDLTQPYFQTLAFLRGKGNYDQTVLELPTVDVSSKIESVSFWYNQSSPSVSVFSDKRTYFSFTGIEFPGMRDNARGRNLSLVLALREHPSVELQKKVVAFLQKENIVYIISPAVFPALLQIRGMKEIYHNQYFIYQFF